MESSASNTLQKTTKSSYDEALAQLQQLKVQLGEETAIGEPGTEAGILSIAIDIGNGRQESIDVLKGDNPDFLASMFCVRHGLNERQRAKLAKLIEKNVAEAMKDSIGTTATTQGFHRKALPPPLDQMESVTPGLRSAKNTIGSGPGKMVPRSKSQAPSSPQSDFEAWQKSIEKNLKDRRKVNKGPTISEMSEKIVARKSRDSLPAYLRLHQEALAKQKSRRANKLSQSVSDIYNDLVPGVKPTMARRRRMSRGELNYGEMLYQRNKQRLGQQVRLWVKLRSEKEQKELRHATFRPAINPRSKSLTRSRSVSRPETRLMESGNKSREKRKREQEERQLQDKLECSFKPQINRRSRKSVTGDEFIRLFTDAKRRREERDNKSASVFPAHSECTFHPDTSLTRHYRTGRSVSLISRARSALKDYDYSHKPVTGRSPKNGRNTASLPIGDYLYSQKGLKSEMIARIREDEAGKSRKSCNTSLVMAESRRLVENMKLASYQKLFEMLDSDEDGLITAKDADISFVPTEVLKLVTPLMCEMESAGLCMRFEDFALALDTFYARLTVPEKKVLLNLCKRGKRRDSEAEMSAFAFQPQILTKSRELAARSKGAGLDLPTRSAHAQRLKQIRLEELLRNREVESLDNCTFHPLLYSSKGSSLISRQGMRTTSKDKATTVLKS